MTDSSSSKKKARKSRATNFVWDDKSDEILSDSLGWAIDKGFQSDNGFKNWGAIVCEFNSRLTASSRKDPATASQVEGRYRKVCCGSLA